MEVEIKRKTALGTACKVWKNAKTIGDIEDALVAYAAAEVDAAVRATVERCAKVAEKWIYYDDPTSGTDPSRHEIAAAIRLSKLEKGIVKNA